MLSHVGPLVFAVSAIPCLFGTIPRPRNYQGKFTTRLKPRKSGCWGRDATVRDKMETRLKSKFQARLIRDSIFGLIVLKATHPDQEETETGQSKIEDKTGMRLPQILYETKMRPRVSVPLFLRPRFSSFTAKFLNSYLADFFKCWS